MKVEANGKTFEIEVPKGPPKLKAKELDALEMAVGGDLQKARGTQMLIGTVWTLVKRQDPTVRFDAIDFDIDEFNDEAGVAVDPTSEAASDTADVSAT